MARRDRYSQDIKRIVGIDPNQTKIGEATRKGDIAGKRGIAYINSDGQTVSSASGTAGITRLTNPTNNMGMLGQDKGSGQNDPDAEDTDGNAVDPTNGSKGSYNYDQGTYDIEDLIDLEDGPTLSDPAEGAGIGNNPTNLGGTLNGLTGLRDLTTDKGMELRLDGKARPPVGWESETDPGPSAPAYTKWTQGKQWIDPLSDTAHTDPLGAAKYGRDFAGDVLYTVVVDSSYNSSFDFWQITFEKPVPDGQVTYQANGATCTPSNSDPVCPITNPIKWPADGVMQLALSGSSFIMSEAEAIEDRITQFMDGNHSRVDFAFGSGREGSLRPTQNGGFMVGETVGGNYVGIVQMYNPSNKLIAYIAPGMTSAYEAR